MPDHLIRLRGGWEWVDADDPEARPARLSLPVEWPAGGPRRVRLARRFGRPPLDPRADSLWLRLAAVEGLRSASLNGAPLALREGPESSWESPLPDLPDRNELVLEADLAAAPPRTSGAPRAWGEVALVVRSGRG